MADYIVKAACVVAKLASDTGEGYFYRGALLPSGVPAAEKKRLVEAGLVTEVDVEVVKIAPGVEAVAYVDHTDTPKRGAK